MKKLLLSITTLLVGSMSFAQLSGTYTIGGVTPDYVSIQDACSDLQTVGQSGPVTFDIRTGNYVESAILNAVAGNSATNSITFTSETGDSTDVLVTSVGPNTFDFNNVSYINFVDMSISFMGPFGNAVSFDNSTDMSFDNVAVFYTAINGTAAIDANRANGIDNFSFVDSKISSSNTGINLNSNLSDINNCTINNVSINAGNYGVNIYAQKFANDLTITDSDIFGNSGAAFWVEGNDGAVNDLTLTNSTFISINYYAFYGYSDYAMNNGSVTDCNFFSDNGYAMYLEGDYQSVSDWTVSNSNFNSKFSAFRAYSSGNISNMSFVNDSIITNNPTGVCCGQSDAFYLDADALIDNIAITDNYFYTDSANYGDYGAYLYSGSGNVSNIDFSSNEIKAYRGVRLYSNSAGLNWNVNDNNISTHYDAVYLEPYYGGGNMIHIMNNDVESAQGAGIYLYSYATMNNTWVSGNTVYCQNDALDIEGYYGSMSNIYVDNNDLMSTNSDGVYMYAYATIQNVEITNNTINSNSIGVDIEGYYGGSKDIVVDNNDITTSFQEAIYFYSYASVSDVEFTNNTLNAIDDYGIYVSGEYGGNDNVLFDNNDVNSYEGYYLYSYTTTNNITISNDSINAQYNAVQIDSDYGGLKNVSITDSYLYSSYEDGLYVYTDYGSLNNLEIMNNVIVADTLGGCCSSKDAIYVESDDSGMDSITIVGNNLYAYNYGIYIEADYGNATNSIINQNNVWAGYYGIYFDGAGSNSDISFNNIYPNLNYGSQTDYGIYLYGYDGPNTGVTVSNNYLDEIDTYGIQAEYFNDIVIENNEILSTDSGDNLYGMYLQYLGGNCKINANQILTDNELEGMYIGYSAFDVLNPLTLSNNFITGMDYGVDFYECTNVNVVHNSISSQLTIDAIYFSNTSDANVWNNVLKNYGTSGNIYRGDASCSNINIDYNAYEYDSLTTFMSNDPFFGTNASLFNFKMATAHDDNSKNADPMFVNDTTDLHISCSNNALIDGTYLAFVPKDVDGISRNLTTPTMGAHEISPLASSDILDDSAVFCNTADLMTTGTGSILWSTGATTSMITVNTPGTYSVTVTDYCGNDYTESIIVYPASNVTASFLWGTNDSQAIFINSSVGAVTYLWNFGDATTSTAETPIHNYPAGDSTYIVTLIAYDNCGGSDTTVQSVTTHFVGLDASLEARGVNVYPNPTSGNVTVDFALLKGESIRIYVLDIDGRIISTDLVNNELGSYQKQLDLSDLADGLYFVRIETETEAITKRVVKQ